MIRAVRLQTEYMDHPIGIDLTCPRLSWKVMDAKKQTGGELCLDTSLGRHLYLPFSGDKMYYLPEVDFFSCEIVRWKVRLSDENGVWGDWSEPAEFEMGFLSPNDWKAKWIMGDYEHDPSCKVRYPVDCFKKEFSAQVVKKARLYITACGSYEAWINGKRVGDFILAPGSTAFQKRVHYQVYDVTDLIRENNEFRVDLADGFYASKAGVFGKGKTFGHEPKLLAQLELYDSLGACTVIGTDNSFLWSNDGPCRFADMKDGEIVDSRKMPSFHGYAQETEYLGIVCSANSVPVREKEHFGNPKVIHCPDGNTVLDFGQNIAGYTEFSVQGIFGHRCSMIFGEKLDKAGNFTYKHISNDGEYTDCHFQRIDFVCNGQRQKYKPRFTVMGFRYALLLDWPEDIKPERFTAIAVYSDMEPTLHFSCSHEGINQIVRNTIWSVKGNFLDVPTDCPTRERAGWTGDAELFAESALFMFDAHSFLRKWLRDVCDVQKENGMVYNINPSMPSGSKLYEWISMEGSVGWGDAVIAIPYFMWKRTGDIRILQSFFPAMERCLKHYLKRLGKRNLFSLFMLPLFGRHLKYISGRGRDFGEWTEPNDCAPSMLTLLLPHPEEATAYIARDVKWMSQICRQLDLPEKAEEYECLFVKIKAAYRHHFLNEKMMRSKRMARLVRPISCGLCDGNEKQKIADVMAQLNRNRQNRIGTGFLSTQAFFDIMTEAGYGDDAFAVLTNADFGWMQQIGEGATTVWENWTDDASLNHYSKGSCCQWLFGCLCGIGFDGSENHFILHPHTVSGLQHIQTQYDSPYGSVVSGWEQTTDGYQFYIAIPSNCTAELTLPNGDKHFLEAGEYCFS